MSNQSILGGRADKSPAGAARSVFRILCRALPSPLLSLGAWRPSGSCGTPTTSRESRRKGRGSVENTQTLRNYMWASVHDSSAETSSHTLLLTRLTMGLGTVFADTRARTSRGSWGCLNTVAPSCRTESLSGCPGSTLLPTRPLAHRTSVSWRGPGQSSYNQDDFALCPRAPRGLEVCSTVLPNADKTISLLSSPSSTGCSPVLFSEATLQL